MSKAVKLKNSLYLASTSIVHKRGGGWYYLNNLLDNIYPVGSIFISTVNTNPSTYFGGTWERIKGRFLLAADDSTYKLGATGGEATHKLTVDEMPSHNHMGRNYSHNWNAGISIPPGRSYAYSYGGASSGLWAYSAGNWINESEINEMVETGNRGGSQSHNNMPPYLVVYIWKRVS